VVITILRQILLVLGLGAPFSLFERRFAARPVAYRKVLAWDIGAYVVVILLGFPAGFVVSMILSHVPVIEVLHRGPVLPLWASVPLAILGSDLAMYWVHRLLHTRPLWRAHRWHHSPRHMYWFAGSRASAIQGVLYTIPPLVFIGLNVPGDVIGECALLTIVSNHWMHANLKFRARWLEAFLVTPRIHHIHHSQDPRHHGRNFGSVFCIWDRMFGTFFDPDDVSAPLEFGIPEVVSGPRMVVGV
jgi:sterol desaturase/sphingolipid hydroxylase (fatty acid hydroxylase superfamily)